MPQPSVSPNEKDVLLGWKPVDAPYDAIQELLQPYGKFTQKWNDKVGDNTIFSIFRFEDKADVRFAMDNLNGAVIHERGRPVNTVLYGLALEKERVDDIEKIGLEYVLTTSLPDAYEKIKVRKFEMYPYSV